jgi:two-component system, OmpR family, phosphate regulon sensor histidine kinase PhoR
MRSLTIFYLLVFYVFVQFCWWAYMLVELNREVYIGQVEYYRLYGRESEVPLEGVLHKKWVMIAGEGIVFLTLLGFGVYKTRKSFQKEMELNRLQRNFLLSVTHEFKSPLAAIRLYLQTLQRHELEKTKRDAFIRNAISDTERLDKLVENALVASLIENSSYSFNKTRVDFSALVKDIAEKSALKSPLRAQVQDGIFIKADPLALSSLVINLVENAAKYSQGAPVVLTLSRGRGKIVLQVIDEGIGIREEEKKKIFEKFYRVGSEETRTTKGTGLGLYISGFIAKAHEGRILVKDNLPKGSIFEVQFPEHSDE